MHVHDVARALLAAVGHAGVFNISTGMRDCRVARSSSCCEPLLTRPFKASSRHFARESCERSCLDPSRAREQLGWGAEIGLEEGLAATYQALTAEFEPEGARATG